MNVVTWLATAYFRQQGAHDWDNKQFRTEPLQGRRNHVFQRNRNQNQIATVDLIVYSFGRPFMFEF